MKHSLTNRALGVGGDSNTTSVTVRLPSDVVAYVDSHLNGRIKNRSEFLQHWAQVGMRVSMDDDLAEALDWALDRSVQTPAGEPDGQAPACKAEEPGSTPGPASEDDLGRAEMANETALRYDAAVVVPLLADELGQIREAQLEALRSRVR